MVLEHSMKNRKVLLLVSAIILAAGTFIFLYSPAIFQEGNPWPQIKGALELNFTNNNIVRLSGAENAYMTKSGNGQEVIKKFMEDKGYAYMEQMGSGYLFESLTESAIVTHRHYSRYFSLWNITETKGKSLTEELMVVCVKSDIESHEKCNELLKRITDYGSCVEAGFSIMKSNPPQCATLDGRTFVEGE
jgi:hypothetical protein